MAKDLYFDPRYDLDHGITRDSQGRRYQQVAPEFGGELIPIDGDEGPIIPIPSEAPEGSECGGKQ